MVILRAREVPVEWTEFNRLKPVVLPLGFQRPWLIYGAMETIAITELAIAHHTSFIVPTKINEKAIRCDIKLPNNTKIDANPDLEIIEPPPNRSLSMALAESSGVSMASTITTPLPTSLESTKGQERAHALEQLMAVGDNLETEQISNLAMIGLILLRGKELLAEAILKDSTLQSFQTTCHRCQRKFASQIFYERHECVPPVRETPSKKKRK